MTPRETAQKIVHDHAFFNDEQPQLVVAITTALQSASNEGLTLARGGLTEYLLRQEEWSSRTFGHGWVDVIILAMDGFWRHGGDPRTLMPMLIAKQQINFARKWPMTPEDEPSEHVR